MNPDDARPTRQFERYRFLVELEASPEDVLEQVPIRDARDALQSEIKSGLESLRGIRFVSVEPTP